ncbi:MAG: ATP-dependent DNA helicase, partial [Alphaproteobacteria bacterium]
MRAASPASPDTITIPRVPILATGLGGAAWLTPEGELETIALAEAAHRARDSTPLLCHGRAVARRLDVEAFASCDILELFAFVRPTRFCWPTARGIAVALDLPQPRTLEDELDVLRGAAARLLGELGVTPRDDPRPVAMAMARAGWPWAASVLAALGEPQPEAAAAGRGPVRGLDIWRRLPTWSEHAPEPPAGNEPVDPAEARMRLAELLGPDAESRPEQADYASAVCAAFKPRTQPEAPRMVIAEAGTGTGKTLGYIAPASVWSEKNHGPVWVSTFTRNLQQQIDGELDRLYPDRDLKPAKVVVRKGRENYLCLLNLEDAVSRLGALRPRDAVGLGLMLRWAVHSRDGDFGGDFPAWLVELAGVGPTLGLADRRGECIYSACPHYDKCFIERSVRRARRADFVVANHALVMVQAALGGMDDTHLPTRYVFDEGHHVFDAADNTFAAHLTARETTEMRRWLLGREAAVGRRGRGLGERVQDLLAGDDDAMAAFQRTMRAARGLPAPGWGTRLAGDRPQGPAEAFLSAVRHQVYSRVTDPSNPYDLETETRPLANGLAARAEDLREALARLRKPMLELRTRLLARLDDEADELDTATRARLEAVARGLERRGGVQLGGWIAMLEALAEETPPEFVDWFGIARSEGRDTDVGMYRHWVDPTVPFATVVAARAQGALITSATLTDGSGDVEADWLAAEARTGAIHLPVPAVRAQVPSPFDYGSQTRVIVVRDVRKDNLDQVAAAYRELFKAAGGGALGLFTAIVRLKEVHRRIAVPLEEAGIHLYAQHVDGLAVATLVDIFRAERDTCLLGTDAVRDGVDVPGRSLRLIVFDRVPWPRPSILHRARKSLFGGSRYVDMLTRLRLS